MVPTSPKAASLKRSGTYMHQIRYRESQNIRLRSMPLGTFQSSLPFPTCSRSNGRAWGGQVGGELEAAPWISTASVLHVRDPKVPCATVKTSRGGERQLVGTDFE